MSVVEIVVIVLVVVKAIGILLTRVVHAPLCHVQLPSGVATNCSKCACVHPGLDVLEKCLARKQTHRGGLLQW